VRLRRHKSSIESLTASERCSASLPVPTRRREHVPIPDVDLCEAVADRVAGLEAGADDYLIKPFALEELLPGVRALPPADDA
jgi:CheY-like chemotaxis protein